MKQPKQRYGKYTSLYMLTRLRHSEHLELRSENGKRLHYNSEFVERFPELSLFFKAYSPLDSEMICIFPYFCPYAESAREIREIFS